MTDSFSVRSERFEPIDVTLLLDNVRKTLCTLLNQSSMSLAFEVTKESQRIQGVLLPAKELLTIWEEGYLGYGVLFTYSEDEYWSTYSDRPIVEFSLLEVSRQKSDLLLAICVAVVISVAELLGVDSVVDYAGVIGRRDEVSVAPLLGAAVQDRLPLDLALARFYENLPVSER